MPMNKKYVVYRHIFPNGKSYIGITSVKPCYYRWRGGSGYFNQPKIYNAILKYGWINVRHEILFDDLTLDEANHIEQEQIRYYDSIENGYNVSAGGGGRYGVPCSAETKAKISTANKNNGSVHHYNLENYIKTHGAWNKGGHLTPEQYAKISAERKARCNKSVTGYNPLSLVAEVHFVSATEAAKFFGVSQSVISRCAKGGRKTSVGYIWRYDDESV